ncbi:MAG: DNA methyltransferase [bacterium]
MVKADFGEWDKWDTPALYLDFVFQVCHEYQRILKPNGSMVLFFSYRYSGWIAFELEKRGLFTFRNPIIFNKVNPQRQYKSNGFRSCHEVGVWLVNDG